jgi:hypothetical protein
MSSSDQNSLRESPQTSRRRSSFVDMFNPRASVPSNQPPGPRRLSITTLGLSTLPGAQTSPFNNIRNRTESVSSANSASVDESPFEDDATGSPQNTTTSVPVTPFGRRMSFGATRTLRGPGNGNAQNASGPNGRAPVSSATFSKNKASASPPTSMSRGLSCCSFHFLMSLTCDGQSYDDLRVHTNCYPVTEGFDFAEQMRQRAERSSISSGASGMASPLQVQPPSHHRSKSIAAMEPPKSEIPRQIRPDAFQERILKGEFYMD